MVVRYPTTHEKDLLHRPLRLRMGSYRTPSPCPQSPRQASGSAPRRLAPVGLQYPQATGSALAFKMRGEDGVALACGGEASTRGGGGIGIKLCRSRSVGEGS